MADPRRIARLLMLGLMLGLSGCVADPASLGLTGPTPPRPPRARTDATVGLPGLPDQAGSHGQYYAPP